MLKFPVCAAIAVVIGFTGTATAEDAAELAKEGVPAYRLCTACHSLQPGIHLSGPSLADLWGKKAASIESYGRYTEGLKKADIVWGADTLNAWLANPQAIVPGTTMTFRGVEKKETRMSLIAFLRQAMAEGGSAKVVKDGLISHDSAEGQIPPDLSSVGENQRIKEIRHCRDAYYVTTADGAEFPFWETNVRIKTDTSARGPQKGEPVLLRSGMAGDRVTVVFSSLAEISLLVAEKC
ncbi:cytochrome c2 iso-2 [bacterium MnTg02]|nr:cytochrome c2 iso-2 [bacterium MnTg02]